MKKVLLVLSTILCCITLCVGFTACDLGESSASSSGGWGEVYTLDVAYAKAQELGYEGSLEEFLASIQGKDGIGIANVQINDEGELIISLSDGQTISLGKIIGKDGKDGVDGVGVSNATINSSGNLIVTLTDGTKLNAGKAHGKDGVGISSAYFNAENELIIVYTDGTEKNAGTVPPCNHEYGAWVEGVKATCTSVGYNYRVCSICEETDYQFFEKTGHKFANYILGKDEYIHSQYCSVCHEKISNLHTYGDDGICTVCGDYYSNGLQFLLSSDASYYTVYKGECTDSAVVIPVIYQGLPVTSIGFKAFSGYSDMTSIVIPNSVTSIGSSAFQGCSGLTSIVIPNSVTSIGDEAFRGCSGLTSIVIPNSVTSIGSSVFYGCSGLTSIVIPDGVTSIGNYAFDGCSGLTSIVIPDSVTSIGDRAFDGCINIAKATMPTLAIDYIPRTNLKEVVISSGTSIGNYAFEYCRGLTSIVIPDSVTSIGSSAFYYCSGLTSIVIPNSVTSIGEYAFYDCYKLIEVYNLSSLTITTRSSENGYVGYYAKNVYTPSSGSSKLTTTQDGYVFYNDGGSYYLMGYVGAETALTLPDKFNGSNYSIYQYAFYNCSGLTSITIPNSVTSIGYSAFEGCSGLTSIVIPNNVTSIGRYAFEDCSGLTSITVASGNTTYHSAGNCLIETASKTLILGCKSSVIPTDGTVTSIGNYAFYNCSGLTSIVIPNSVTSIGNNAFKGCSGIIQEEGGVSYVDKWVIDCDESVTSVNLRANTVGIADSAFAYCSGLTSITIGNSVTSIGSYAFYECSGLTSITIPNSVTSIGNYAFEYCRGLTSITIPNSVTSIGSYAFYNCDGLTSITYQGTKAQWNAISKGSLWNYNTGAYTITCTDGTIAKS